MSENFSPGDMSPEEKRTLLAKLLREKASQKISSYPASDGQRAMFIVQSLSPESHAYHFVFSIRIYSEVNVASLRKAIQFVVDRHPALTTTYALRDDDLVQNVAEWQEAAFEQVDASAWSEAELFQQVEAVFHQPIDLINGPVIHWKLFTRGTFDHIFMFCVHHISIDAWSLTVLLKDLRVALEAYSKGSTPNLPPVVQTYSQWSKWQAEMLVSPAGERLKAYWKQQLAGNLATLNLIPDFPRPAGQSHKGDSFWFTMVTEKSKRIKALAQSEGNTLFMVLLAAFQVLLHRYTGQEEILVGTPSSGRTQAEYNGVVGYFVNPVTLRGQLGGNPTFRELLARNRQIVLNALEHQDFPFLRVVQNLESRPDPGRSPVFQCMFNLVKFQPGDINASLSMDIDVPPVEFAGMQVSSYPLRQQEGQFELTLDVMDNGETLTFILNYQTDLFHRQTITRLMRSLERLMDGLIETPAAPISELPILSPEEQKQILVEWNQTQANYPNEVCLQQLFELQVERTPDSIALIYEDRPLTYRQLNQRTNQMAHHLRALGVGSDDMVGIFLERSLDMVIAILGVMKAGGAYVPMDPIYPPQRIQSMMEDSQMQVLITQRSLLDSLPSNTAQCVLIDENRILLDNQIKDNPDPIGSSDSLAYVIFTSGSTGRPKGVQIPHRALVNFLLSMQQQPGIQPDDALASVTTLSFDIAGLELFLPLISGARVIILSADTSTDGVALAQALDHYAATILQATPATWRLLVETGWPGRPGLKMLCGGEPLPLPLAQQLLQKGGDLWNMYGPTETTIWSTLRQITHDDTVISIGHPIANTQAYILDPHLQPVPPGVIGSLYIGGDGLARGYLNRPDLTAEKFIDHPFKPGERIYHTGDLARYQADGSIECLGRDDSQVKIRGFRIELGEIETVLRTHPAIKHAVILAREDFPGDKRLVVYYTAEGSPTSRELSRFLREKLPSYMIPSVYVALDVFPQTPNGKVNRQALPAPVQSNVEIQTHSNPPTTTYEILVAEIWKELLQVDRISVFDNFFDLGGHSLLAMRVVAQIQEKCGIRIEPAYLRIESLGQLAMRLNDSSS